MVHMFRRCGAALSFMLMRVIAPLNYPIHRRAFSLRRYIWRYNLNTYLECPKLFLAEFYFCRVCYIWVPPSPGATASLHLPRCASRTCALPLPPTPPPPLVCLSLLSRCFRFASVPCRALRACPRIIAPNPSLLC